MASLRTIFGLWVVAASLFFGAACGGSSNDADSLPKESPYSKCRLPADRLAKDDQAMCEQYAMGVEIARGAAQVQGHEHVRKNTEDGYRLRGTVAIVLLAVGGWIAGTLFGSLLVTWARRRRGTRYARHVLRIIRREADAVRELGHSSEVLVQELVRRVHDVLARSEEHATGLAKQCGPLEPRSKDPTRRAHLRALYEKLDVIAACIEHLHVQVTVWREHVADLHGIELEAEVEAARQDLMEALEEVS